MRLIDADELNVFYHVMDVGANYGGLRAIVFKRDIDNAPTMSVGRCKDCKYNPRNPRSYYDNDKIYTYAMCGHLNGGEDGFCSNYKPFGERKES